MKSLKDTKSEYTMKGMTWEDFLRVVEEPRKVRSAITIYHPGLAAEIESALSAQIKHNEKKV